MNFKGNVGIHFMIELDLNEFLSENPVVINNIIVKLAGSLNY